MVTSTDNSRMTSVIDGAQTPLNMSVENYGAFSASEITAFIDNVQVGTLTSISYQIHTEKVAQYTFGSANPRRFVTGKRGIAGSITFNMFDRSALLAIFAGSNQIGQPLIGSASNLAVNMGILAPGTTGFVPVTTVAAGLNDAAIARTNDSTKTAFNNVFSQPLEYTDQLPPFDLTLAMVDNQGRGAYMVIGGMEIINEGAGYSIDDMVTQQAFTFVARYMRPLTPVNSNGTPIPAGSIPTIQVTK